MLCLLLSACAGKKQDAWLHDKKIVVDAIAKTQTDQSNMAKTLQDQEQRLAKLEGQIKKQDTSLDAIQASLEAMHTRIKQLDVASRAHSKRSHRAAESSLVKKLDKVEKSIAEVAPPPSAAATTPPPPPQLTSEDEKNRYTAAYLALKSGRYDEATATFEKLLKDFPKGQLTDQAYYWLGESFYAQNNLKSAIHAFEQVVTHYPDSPKYATALLRLGTAFKESGDTGRAMAAFQRLIREHPDSPEAANARSLMQQMPKGDKKTSR